MAKLSKDDILKLAKLARLRLSQAEVEKFQTEIGAILGYVEMLGDVDTTGLKPSYQVSGLTNVTRPDTAVEYGATQESLLKNVPGREGDYIKVKRMIS